MKNTRKGFTLVELLIVIVVIGILSAMMMLSSSEAVSSAKASTITSNLRNLKTAALACYTDNMDDFDAGKYAKDANKDFDATEKALVIKYLNGNEIPDIDDYKIRVTKDRSWFVVYSGANGNSSEAVRIREKLKGRAKSLGLVKADGDNYTTTYTGEGNVALQIR